LGKVQAGLDPTDWKPFGDVGAGTREIRIRDVNGVYRVMYVAKFEEAIYVALLPEEDSSDQQAG
jgi:phage-related protein